MIQAYKKFWKRYGDFSGVTTCKDYWLAVLSSVIVTMILEIIGAIPTLSGLISVLLTIYSIAIIVPSVAVIVRRLRDAGQAWGNIFWLFLPLVGSIILIVKLCKPSAKSDGNR